MLWPPGEVKSPGWCTSVTDVSNPDNEIWLHPVPIPSMASARLASVIWLKYTVETAVPEIQLGCTRLAGYRELLVRSLLTKYEPCAPSVPLLLSVLHAIVKPSVLSFPASIPRYATLVITCPAGQLNVPPDGLVTLLPNWSFWLSNEFGVLNALPSDTVDVQL